MSLHAHFDLSKPEPLRLFRNIPIPRLIFEQDGVERSTLARHSVLRHTHGMANISHRRGLLGGGFLRRASTSSGWCKFMYSNMSFLDTLGQLLYFIGKLLTWLRSFPLPPVIAASSVEHLSQSALPADVR